MYTNILYTNILNPGNVNSIRETRMGAVSRIWGHSQTIGKIEDFTTLDIGTTGSIAHNGGCNFVSPLWEMMHKIKPTGNSFLYGVETNIIHYRPVCVVFERARGWGIFSLVKGTLEEIVLGHFKGPKQWRNRLCCLCKLLGPTVNYLHFRNYIMLLLWFRTVMVSSSIKTKTTGALDTFG